MESTPTKSTVHNHICLDISAPGYVACDLCERLTAKKLTILWLLRTGAKIEENKKFNHEVIADLFVHDTCVIQLDGKQCFEVIPSNSDGDVGGKDSKDNETEKIRTVHCSQNVYFTENKIPYIRVCYTSFPDVPSVLTRFFGYVNDYLTLGQEEYEKKYKVNCF